MEALTIKTTIERMEAVAAELADLGAGDAAALVLAKVAELRAEPEPAPTPRRDFDRDEAVAAIRAALKRRGPDFGLKYGDYTVTTGRGTSWGWIKVDAAPRIFREASGGTDSAAGFAAEYAVREKLNALFGLARTRSSISIPASGAYRNEYVDRAEGLTPSVIAEPYWD